MNERPDDTSEDDSLKGQKSLDGVFSKYSNLETRIRSAAAFLRFLSSRVDIYHLSLDAPSELALGFEPVCLWIRRVLPDLAPEVHQQALKLLDESRIQETIARLHSLTRSQRSYMRYRLYSNLPVAMVRRAIDGIFRRTPIEPELADFVTENNLQATKTTLLRLAGMLEYAAIDLDEQEDFDDFVYRDHFDPSQIDRGRIISLLRDVAENLESLPPGPVKDRLLANVRAMKEEVSRPKPRWRKVLATAVVLLAVVGDFKQVFPETTDRILRLVEAVIKTVVTESHVTARQVPANGHSEGPRHWAMETKKIAYVQEGQEDGDEGKGNGKR